MILLPGVRTKICDHVFDFVIGEVGDSGGCLLIEGSHAGLALAVLDDVTEVSVGSSFEEGLATDARTTAGLLVAATVVSVAAGADGDKGLLAGLGRPL